jgi:hypothetical protein
MPEAHFCKSSFALALLLVVLKPLAALLLLLLPH